MSEENPWKTLGSKVVYKNNWITVREDSIIKPNGENGIYGVIDCKIATGIIPVFDDLTTILVGQYRYAMNQYSWEIIEGGAELDESPAVAALRELKEEAGMISETAIPLGGEIHLSNSHSSERGFLFYTRDFKLGKATPEDTEVLKIKRIPILQALELVEENMIQDSLSIIGLYRIARLLKLT